MPKKPQDLPDNEQDDDEVEEFAGDQTIVMSTDDDDEDDSLDISMEVNVEKLMTEIDKTAKDDVERRKAIRRRLEEIQEERSIEDTYSFDLYGED